LIKALKVLTLLAVTGSLVLFGFAGWNILCAQGTFAVRHLEILDVNSHPRAPILSALKPLYGTNLMNVKPERVTTLLASIPWIEGFTCRKHLPDTLIVEIRERKGLCAAVFGQDPVEIDGAGGWWKAPPGTKARLVVGEGLKPSDPSLQKLILQLIKPGSPVRVVSVCRSGETGAYILDTDGGWKLKVSAGDLEAQLARFATAEKWAENHHPLLKTMDVRWKDKVVLSSSTGESVSAGSVSDGKGGTNG